MDIPKKARKVRKDKDVSRKQRNIDLLYLFTGVYGYETTTPLKRIANTLEESVQNIQNWLNRMEDECIITRVSNGTPRQGQTILVHKSEMERYEYRCIRDNKVKQMRIKENNRKRYLESKKKTLKRQEEEYNKIENAIKEINGEETK